MGRRSIEKRRNEIEDFGVVLDEDADEKAYQLYKKRRYGELVIKSLLTFALGGLLRFLLGKL